VFSEGFKADLWNAVVP